MRNKRQVCQIVAIGMFGLLISNINPCFGNEGDDFEISAKVIHPMKLDQSCFISLTDVDFLFINPKQHSRFYPLALISKRNNTFFDDIKLKYSQSRVYIRLERGFFPGIGTLFSNKYLVDLSLKNSQIIFIYDPMFDPAKRKTVKIKGKEQIVFSSPTPFRKFLILQVLDVQISKELMDVEIKEETVELNSGVKQQYKVEKSIERVFQLEEKDKTVLSIGSTFRGLITAALKHQVERNQKTTIKEKETIEKTLVLDGARIRKAKIIWCEQFRVGSARVILSGEDRNDGTENFYYGEERSIPFQYRDGFSLKAREVK